MFVLPPLTSMPAPREADDSDSSFVWTKSDDLYPIEIGDSTAYCLVGNFAAYHNGAVITADSAVRYSDTHIECFGNVLINKNTTYVYGDRAVYDGDRSEAQVYSDLVKVADGDALLYTYAFLFNTLDNVGEYRGGGVLTKEDNKLESMRGYYFSDTHEIVCVDRVQMRNDSYEMEGDSVVYNTDTDEAYFFTRTNIWNSDGDYLYTDRGEYDKARDVYILTRNGYILTPDEEMWSDSLTYYRSDEHIVLRHDIQVDERQYKMLSFGDYGEYWNDSGEALLTRRPFIVNYDPEQGEDSLFMRADTIRLVSRYPGREAAEAKAAAADSLRRAAEAVEAAAASAAEQQTESVGEPVEDTDREQVEESAEASLEGNNRPERLGDSRRGRFAEPPAGEGDSIRKPHSPAKPMSEADMPPAQDSLSALPVDSLAAVYAADSTMRDTTPVVMLSKKELRDSLRREALRNRAEQKKIKAQAKKAKLTEIGIRRRNKEVERFKKEEERMEARRRKAFDRRMARLARKGVKLVPVGDTVFVAIDSMLRVEAAAGDSIMNALLAGIYVAAAEQIVDSLEEIIPLDSVYRIVKGYRDVKMYRPDFQVVCDSMVMATSDSVVRMRIDPVLWNEDNQITAEQMDIVTFNQSPVRGEFTGHPIMAQQIDTTYYNQVAGKDMTAFFRDNAIYRNDVDANAQTIYFIQDEDTGEVHTMMYVESADASFYIEDNTIDNIVYRGNPNYIIYPLDKIPESQPRRLQGFEWRGERRPSRDSICTRIIRPSQRERVQQIERPSFPIAEQIELYKASLVEQRRWSDRNDVLTPETLDWIATEVEE